MPDVWDLGDGLAGDLLDAGAIAALALLIVKLHTGQGAVSRVRDWRQAGQTRALRRQVEANVAEICSLKVQVGALNQGIALSHAAVGRQVPPEVSANAPTMPQLRVVGD